MLQHFQLIPYPVHDLVSRDQLPEDQLSRDQLATRSTQYFNVGMKIRTHNITPQDAT